MSWGMLTFKKTCTITPVTAKSQAMLPSISMDNQSRKQGEVVQSGLKFEIGRPASHRAVAESAGRPAGSAVSNG